MILILGVSVGLALGLTGGGGSIFAVPLLIYGVGVPVHAAIAISLTTVAITSAFGAGEGIVAGIAEIRVGTILAVAGMITAPLGVWVGNMTPETIVLTAFCGLTVIVAARMAFQAVTSPQQARAVRGLLLPGATGNEPRAACRYDDRGRLRVGMRGARVLVPAGASVGLLSGFFGVGGGFLIVPCLLRFTDMGMHRAVATSLYVIALIGLAGALSAFSSGRVVDVGLLSIFLAGSLFGMIGGRGLARVLAGSALQLIFAVLLLVMAVAIVAQRTGLLGSF